MFILWKWRDAYMNKHRAALISTLMLSLFAVATASISTFAWFQANANVTINASSTSTTITVSKPESQYEYYAYRGNKTLSHVAGATDYDHDSDYDFQDDFISLSSSNVSSETNLETLGFYPGRSFSFALKVNNLVAGTSVVNFSTTTITSNDASKQGGGLNNRYVNGSNNVQINIGWAINIHAIVSTSASGYASFVNLNPNTSSFLTSYPDLFEYGYDADYGEENPDPLAAGSNASQSFSLSNNLIEDYTALTSSIYIFYRIVFSNMTDTLYREIDGSGNDVYEPTEGDSDRLFVAYTSDKAAFCTSNCYAGLRFALNTLNLDISEAE